MTSILSLTPTSFPGSLLPGNEAGLRQCCRAVIFFRCANVSARVTTMLNPKKSHGVGGSSEIKNKSLAFSYMGCFITLVIRARACSGKPWVKKFGYLCIQEFWF